MVVWFVVWSRVMSTRSETLARTLRGLLGFSSTELALSYPRKHFLTVAYSAVVCSERRRVASLTTMTKADCNSMLGSQFRTQPDSFEQGKQGQIISCSRDVPTRATKCASPSRHRHRGFQSDFSLFIAQCPLQYVHCVTLMYCGYLRQHTCNLHVGMAHLCDLCTYGGGS